MVATQTNVIVTQHSGYVDIRRLLNSMKNYVKIDFSLDT